MSYPMTSAKYSNGSALFTARCLVAMASVLQATTPYAQSHVPPLTAKCVSSWIIVPAWKRMTLEEYRDGRKYLRIHPSQWRTPKQWTQVNCFGRAV